MQEQAHIEGRREEQKEERKRQQVNISGVKYVFNVNPKLGSASEISVQLWSQGYPQKGTLRGEEEGEEFHLCHMQC